MQNRTTLLVAAIIGVVLLAVGGTVGVMTLAHSGFMGNNGDGMMNGQSANGTMMGGYQQTPVQQGTRELRFLTRRTRA